jgi:hypothetical protein
MRANRSTVLLVLPERWLRVAIRAELVARGCHVAEMTDLADVATFRPDRARHGAVRLILVDENALGGAADGTLALVRGRHRGVPLVLLQGWAGARRGGAWNAVIARSREVREIADRVEELLPLADREARLSA